MGVPDCALVSGPRGYFPPEPFRGLGVMEVRNAIRRKERAEDENRPVAWYDKQLGQLNALPSHQCDQQGAEPKVGIFITTLLLGFYFEREQHFNLLWPWPI